MTTQTKQNWIMLEPMEDSPVYSFVCPDCTNSVIKFIDERDWKFVEKVENDKRCVVCDKCYE